MSEPPSRLEGGLRERHKARRRDRILEAVRELVRESPETAVSIERIAERAEVAPATVYNLIGPRERLWEALAASFTAELDRRVGAAPARDPIERAQAVVSSTVGLFTDDPIVSRRMLREWAESGLVLDRSPMTHLRGAMTDAQADGLLRADIDVDALAAVVGSGCLGAMHEWAAGLIDDERFHDRAMLALDVACAAGLTDTHRGRLLARLGRRRVTRRRKARAA